ncbi:catalase, partial [Staphylococcus capitis]|uniref:catalase n=1 Tax=Staphylococcus capitis TaxID=29388 RepID=UPI0037093EC8
MLDVEEGGFGASNIVAGLDFCGDKAVEGRLSSYGDAERYGLGVNHWEIVVNEAKGLGVEKSRAFSGDG